MSFASYPFLLLLLPVLLVTWHLVGLLRREWLGGALLLFSLGFLALIDPRAPLLLLGMVLINYGFGLALAAPGDTRTSLSRRALLWLAILLNIAPLVIARWPGLAAGAASVPFLASLPAVPILSSVAMPGAPAQAPAAPATFTLAHAVLPGLAFWILVQLAWLAGVYRRQFEPEGLFRHAVFSSLLPCLPAGPILRYEQVAGQLDALTGQPARPTRPAGAPLAVPPGGVEAGDLAAGLARLVIGLAKKVLLADTLAIPATAAFAAAADGAPLSWLEAWGGVLCFSLQIYFDFSGYTDMALGVGRMLGLRLPENFHSPYRATGPIEFWRRWHMTLSSWLRDCVYVPLGGEWLGGARQAIGLAATMLVVSLWHGFGWGFLAWGALHAALIVMNHVARVLAGGRALESMLASAPVRAICACVTFLLVSLCWVPLRSASLEGAIAMARALAGLGVPADMPAPGLLAAGVFAAPASFLVLAAGLAVVFFLPSAREFIYGRPDGSRCRLALRYVRGWAVLMALLAAAGVLMLDSARPFIF